MNFKKSLISNRFFTLMALFCLFFSSYTVPQSGMAQNALKGVAQTTQTVIEGYIIAEKGDTIPFANVSFANTTKGVTADENGYFQLISNDLHHDTLQVTAVGFAVFKQKIRIGETQNITVHLISTDVQLQTVEVHQQRYRNRGNPAVELIQKVIDHKSANRLESHDFYQYEQYEKLD